MATAVSKESLCYLIISCVNYFGPKWPPACTAVAGVCLLFALAKLVPSACIILELHERSHILLSMPTQCNANCRGTGLPSVCSYEFLSSAITQNRLNLGSPSLIAYTSWGPGTELIFGPKRQRSRSRDSRASECLSLPIASPTFIYIH